VEKYRFKLIVLKMSIEELHSFLDSSTLQSSDISKVELLLEAINDWVNPVETLADFVIKLQKDLKSDDISQLVIEQRVKDLNPVYDAWKMESYATVIELIQLCGYKSLNEIVADTEQL
jgi:hypothetical protein